MAKKTKKETTFVVVDGDVFKEFFESKGSAIFMHGANCHKIMGAGVANGVRLNLASLFYADQFDPRIPAHRLGSYSAVLLHTIPEQGILKIGANIYSQFNPGPDFNGVSFRNGLKTFALSISEEKKADFTVYMPKIGAGIGGGKWEEIEPIVREELEGFNVVIVNYVPEKSKELEKKVEESK